MKNRTLCASIAALSLIVWPNTSFANNVEFNSQVNSTCSIAVTSNGTLRVNPNARTLTSAGAGGQHGLATVTANSNIFRLYVDQPTDFTTRPAADTAPDQDYLARIRSFGATVFNWTEADQALNAGTNNVRILFRARKAPGNSFANGDYTAVVVIRCE